MFFPYIFIVNISDLATKHTHTYPTLFFKQTFTTGWMIWMDGSFNCVFHMYFSHYIYDWQSQHCPCPSVCAEGESRTLVFRETIFK